MIWLTMICVTCAVICLISWRHTMKLHKAIQSAVRTEYKKVLTSPVAGAHKSCVVCGLVVARYNSSGVCANCIEG